MMVMVHLAQSNHLLLHQLIVDGFATEAYEAYHALGKKIDSTFRSFCWPINCKFAGSIYILI